MLFIRLYKSRGKKNFKNYFPKLRHGHFYKRMGWEYKNKNRARCFFAINFSGLGIQDLRTGNDLISFHQEFLKIKQYIYH